VATTSAISAGLPTATFIQRQEVAEPPAAEEPPPAPEPAPAPEAPATSDAPPGEAQAAQQAPGAPGAGQPDKNEPDEMVKKLFDPLLRRLKAELRLDRERRGVLTDRWH
jgi:hypothetical protein